MGRVSAKLHDPAARAGRTSRPSEAAYKRADRWNACQQRSWELRHGRVVVRHPSGHARVRQRQQPARSGPGAGVHSFYVSFWPAEISAQGFSTCTISHAWPIVYCYICGDIRTPTYPVTEPADAGQAIGGVQAREKAPAFAAGAVKPLVDCVLSSLPDQSQKPKKRWSKGQQA